MAATPEPAPVPAAQPEGDIYQNYDPTGALGGLFAPAYIPGYAPSEKAVAEWMKNNTLSSAQVEQTRMPNLYVDPAASGMSGGDGVYGGPMPLKQMYGDSKGMVDPEALRVAAQGGHYDMEGRRNAIAARLAENARLQAPKLGVDSLVDATRPPRDPMEMYKWPYAGGPPGGD